MKYTLLYICCLSFLVPSVWAQSHPIEEKAEPEKKSWEISLGGSVFHMSRTSFSNFSKGADGAYRYDLNLSHALWGGNISVARELNSHFYLDLQGTIGATNEALGSSDKKWYGMAGIGLQWRLGEYFGSHYVDPYLRAGMNYMYKDFKVFYTGKEGLAPDEMTWIMENLGNKEGADKQHLLPISLGGGLNTWLNDRIGIGFEANYLLMPYKNVANSVQGTVRIIYRIGGKSKKRPPVIQYIDRPVEHIVEKTVEVEKRVETPAAQSPLAHLFNYIHFDFDNDAISTESMHIVDEIAWIILNDRPARYLITGYADSRGAATYNQSLSEHRAKAVLVALIERGVPAESLKARGAGSLVAIATPETSQDIRSGDRKVSIELITNDAYWEYLEEKGY